MRIISNLTFLNSVNLAECPLQLNGLDKPLYSYIIKKAIASGSGEAYVQITSMVVPYLQKSIVFSAFQ